MTMHNFISLIGVIALMAIALLLSTGRKRINLRIIFWGLALQFAFAALVFWFPQGIQLFSWLNDAVITIISFAREGIYFVFGPLALSPGQSVEGVGTSIGFILAFQMLPTIVFFSAAMAFLYHIGFMPWLIGIFAKVFSRLMRISGAESLCTASNIFVGVESACTVTP